ncbi:MAG TPA: site-specific integrase [Dysgonomonas sp.]|uniref:site-specific integrase n=1 Tax=Dysgonomonas TaxID=156973 RepID=UPI0025B9400C|nr:MULTISPECIES: site-specific integrase [unclassified Dysgonomonas]HML64717.1 site-specific integrase [Dysgonomonas sp.]
MKATLKILLRKNYVTKEGKRQVCLRYTAYRQCTFIGLNISVLPQHWSEKRLAVLSGDERFLFYNELIKKMYHKADGIIIENYLKPLPVCEFISKLKDQNYGNTDFYVFIEKEIELLKASRASGTISNYNKLINTMKEWKPSLSFSEITLEYIQLYHNHEIEVGNQLSTIYKKHANFKFLIGLAIDKEMIKKNPYDKFEIKKSIKAQNNDVLTEEELQKLQTAYDEDKYKEGKNEVLREFLFSCYTSLSFAEFSEVTYGDLKLIKLKSKEAYPLLCNERTKTNIPYKIPIVSPIVVRLLENGESFQKIFDPLTNQPTNRYLKEIMKDLKINKTMTFHRARHSFRTIAAKKGIRDSIAERIMGHAEGNDIKDIYTHLQDEDIVQEMLDKWVV